MTGPALAGVLLSLGGVGLAYAVHAGLVVIAALTLLPLHVAPTRDLVGLELGAIRDGIAFVWRQPVLLGAMTLAELRLVLPLVSPRESPFQPLA